jgi:hypothetical protein
MKAKYANRAKALRQSIDHLSYELLAACAGEISVNSEYAWDQTGKGGS